MRKIIFSLFITLIFVTAACAAPKKIISLNPVGTEILFALGQGDKVVGVTKYCDYPPQAKKKPVVADYFNGMNIETLLRRNIDLVVVSDLQDALVARLKKQGIKYVVIHQSTVSDVYTSIIEVGRACNAEDTAIALVTKIKTDLAQIKHKVAKCNRPTAVICISREISDPSIKNFYAAGNETFYSDLLDIAAGHNIVKSRSTNYQHISTEGLVALNPEVIIDIVGDKSAYHDNIKKTDLNKLFDKRKLKEQWLRAYRVKATQSGKVYIFDGTLFLRPGPRMAQIALAFAQALHPEAFKQQ